ncbi:unnamed protein product, partial [Ectocarpus sp. 12 AP-2014]
LQPRHPACTCALTCIPFWRAGPFGKTVPRHPLILTRTPARLLVHSDHRDRRRREQVPGRTHSHFEAGLRSTRKSLVCVYSGAAACLAGVLWGVQECAHVWRVRRRTHTSCLVVFSHILRHTEQARQNDSSHEPRAGFAGAWLDMGALDGPLAACCNCASARAGTSAAKWSFICIKGRVGGLTSKSQKTRTFLEYAGEHRVMACLLQQLSPVHSFNRLSPTSCGRPPWSNYCLGIHSISQSRTLRGRPPRRN